MLNRAPIFINGFAYGGTNLITNILASHPEVCRLSSETHVLFEGKRDRRVERVIRLATAWPINAAGGRPISSTSLRERRPLSPALLRYMDLIFYLDKIMSPMNDFKSEGVRYTLAQKSASRFLAKNMNAVALANEIFATAYPDATFIGIIRDGLAICEGFSRRGRSVEKFAALYDRVCRKMIEQSRTINNFHIVRYEDMVRDPVGFMREVYSYAGLTPVPMVRLQAKRVMKGDGTREYLFGSGRDREASWFPAEELPLYITGGANENQRNRLASKDRETFMRIAGGVMKDLGYSG